MFARFCGLELLHKRLPSAQEAHMGCAASAVLCRQYCGHCAAVAAGAAVATVASVF